MSDSVSSNLSTSRKPPMRLSDWGSSALVGFVALLITNAIFFPYVESVVNLNHVTLESFIVDFPDFLISPITTLVTIVVSEIRYSEYLSYTNTFPFILVFSVLLFIWALPLFLAPLTAILLRGKRYRWLMVILVGMVSSFFYVAVLIIAIHMT